VLDYNLPPRIWEAFRFGIQSLIKIDLAAGAEEVTLGHIDPNLTFKSEKDLAKLDGAVLEAGRIAVFSAHVMGGAMMGDDAAKSVVRSSDLRHHSVTNLHVMDGSVLPTSLGVNPQETLYGLAHLMSARFAQSWAK
jgi:choline dehydrogenase-like flavoprotein